MNIKRKLVLAVIAYVALGVLVWQTLSNEPIRVFDFEVRLRTATLLIVGLFAFKTFLHYWRLRIEETDAAKADKG